MTKITLSLNAMDKLLRKAGALRVSESAKIALAEALEEKAMELGQRAKRLAEYSGRKTVIDKDVQTANKED